MVTGFYKELFTDNEEFTPFCLTHSFPLLDDQALANLGREVSYEEIHRSIKSMGALKAPSPDGFQTIFYQSQWKIVGDDFCRLIRRMFQDPSQIKELNDTLLMLIPKVDSVVTVKDFRPISLCNVSYKVITKIIAQRLRAHMNSLVSPCQCSFIPKRHSNDNIVTAQEIFHSMRTKKWKKVWMAIKIDLEKAYDHLKWSFIIETLIDIGCPENLVNIIWKYISTKNMRVLWHGEALDSFQPERGVHQGDPLSPYLFVLCLERLFHLISLAEDHSLWKSIQLVRGGPKISHLAFADDLLLFAEIFRPSGYYKENS